jgi:hypothetical protein
MAPDALQSRLNTPPGDPARWRRTWAALNAYYYRWRRIIFDTPDVVMIHLPPFLGLRPSVRLL